MQTFTKIKGLSDSRRMPRLDKVRLGCKIQKIKNPGKQNQTTTEFPVELPFFLLPEEVAKIHGWKQDPKILVERAKELKVTRSDVLKFVLENAGKLSGSLPVMIPVEDTNHSFPQAYKMYGGSIGLKCTGDGETAQERVGITSEFQPRTCPCDQLKNDKNPRGNCSIVANLQVMLPEVSAGGVFQIDIGSINSIIDINSGIDYIRSVVGRVAMIPMELKRIPLETHHNGAKQTHYTCQLVFKGNIHAIADMQANTKILTHNQVLQLDAPDTSDPKMDKPDAVYEESPKVRKMIDELRKIGNDKKLKQSEGKAIAEALDQNNDDALEIVYNEVKKRMSGTTADDVTAKLKSTTEPPQEKQEAPATKKQDSRF